MSKEFLNLENLTFLSKKQQKSIFGGTNPSRMGEVSFSDNATDDDDLES